MKWVIAILIFSLLVLFHEFGHFVVAKLNGVTVEEFSLGFGPRLLSVKKGETRYSLKLLMFGGSCRMKGMIDEEELEDEDSEEGDSGEEDSEVRGTGKEKSEGGGSGQENSEARDSKDYAPAVRKREPEEGSFLAASVGRRAAIIFAGPFFNFLLAFICAVIVMSVVGYDPALVTSVTEGSSAEEAGLKEGDVITSFMGEHVDIGRDVSTWFVLHDLSADEKVTMTVKRGGKTIELSYLPDVERRYMIGISYTIGNDTAVVESVSVGSPLDDAGIRSGDVITAVNGTAIGTSQDLYDYFKAHPLTADPVTLTLSRSGREFSKTVTPTYTDYVQTGFNYNLYRYSTTPLGVIRYSFIEVRYWITTTVKSLGAMFTGRFGINDLSGPVGVVDIVGTTYEETKSEGALMTWMNMLNLIIMLSADLGVMNLLPIPAIDGGRLLFLIIEAVRGKPVSQKVELGFETVAAVLLMFLMVYVMYHDIVSMIGFG